MSTAQPAPPRNGLVASQALAAARNGELRKCTCGCGYFVVIRNGRTRRFAPQLVRLLESRALVAIRGDLVTALPGENPC